MTTQAAEPRFRVKEESMVIYKLSNRDDSKPDGEIPYPPRTILRTEDVILENGKSTTIRYIEGVPTIYKTKQKDLDPAYRKPTSVTFLHGELSVDPRNETLIEFLDKCNWNASNPDRVNTKPPLFYKVERAKEFQKQFDSLKLETEAREKAWNDSEEHMMKYAAVLGIATSKMGIDEVRVAYIKKAAQDPHTFLNGFDSTYSDIKFLVINAMRKGEVMDIEGELKWKEGGLITKTPKGTTATEHLVEYALKDKELVKRLEKFVD